MALTTRQVRELFSYLEEGNGEKFFEHVAEDVRWTVKGLHPVAGTYSSKEAFLEGAIRRLQSIFVGEPRFIVDHVYVDGDTAIVEMHTTATEDLRGVPFDNEYCWICRFSGDKIVEARAYLCSLTLNYFLCANERRNAQGADVR